MISVATPHSAYILPFGSRNGNFETRLNVFTIAVARCFLKLQRNAAAQDFAVVVLKVSRLLAEKKIPIHPAHDPVAIQAELSFELPVDMQVAALRVLQKNDCGAVVQDRA